MPVNLKQKSALTKIFAISGTILLWAPFLFMLVTAIWGSIQQKSLMIDYLMLAELFPIVALGLILLVLASLISRVYAKWFGWGSVAALVALAGGQIFATVTGLAAGASTQANAAMTIVIVSIVIFNLIILALAILSIVFLRQLFSKAASPEATNA